MATGDLETLGKELLKIGARAAIKASAKATESLLVDAHKGIRETSRRVEKAIARTRLWQEVFDDESEDESEDGSA